VTLAYTALIIASVVLFAKRPLILFAILVPSTVALMVITARTTRGGWHWRWGSD
jgi:hypothetical protein